MSRSIDKEWIGKNDDSRIPDRVRVRVFDRYGGRCHISGRKIQPGDHWDCDHIIALINGGEHRETNLAPAIKDKHREKTAEDVREKSIVARKRKKHLGIKKKGSSMPGSKGSKWKRKMDGTVVRR
jgi:5-methylcytosine-specific restriction endonuclease McrA